MSSGAEIDLYAIRQRLGGQVFDGGLRWVGPGPGHGPRDASLSVRICGERALVHSFSGDDYRECKAHLGITREEGARQDQSKLRERQRAERDVEHARKRAWCADVWRETSALTGTIAARYLSSRGLTDVKVPDIRFHPAAPMDYDARSRFPAMVCAVRDDTGLGRGLHVTALTRDGRKAMANPRRMFGECSKGGVMIGTVVSGEIAVAEGVETALAFHKLTGHAVMCRLSAGGVETYTPTSDVSIVHNAMDDDKAGWKAADVLERRIGRKVGVVRHNPGEGRDWNDVLMLDLHQARR